MDLPMIGISVVFSVLFLISFLDVEIDDFYIVHCSEKESQKMRDFENKSLSKRIGFDNLENIKTEDYFRRLPESDKEEDFIIIESEDS